MCHIKPLSENRFGVYDGDGRRIFLLEKEGLVEWSVRESRSNQPGGRGRPLVVFIGSDSFDRARGWVEQRA